MGTQLSGNGAPFYQQLIIQPRELLLRVSWVRMLCFECTMTAFVLHGTEPQRQMRGSSRRPCYKSCRVPRAPHYYDGNLYI